MTISIFELISSGGSMDELLGRDRNKLSLIYQIGSHARKKARKLCGSVEGLF